MTDDEWDWLRRSCEAQGKPVKLEDPAIIEEVVAIFLAAEAEQAGRAS